MLRKILIIGLLSIPFLSFSSDLAIVENAMSKISEGEDDFRYKYSVQTIEDDQISTIIARFDPLTSPKHSLVKVDGKTPSKKEIKTFYKNLNDEEESNKNFSDIFDGKYNYITTEGEISSYSYTAKMELMPGKQSLLNGKVWINNNKEEVVKVVLENKKDIKVQTGVKLKNFQLEFNFVKYSSDISVVDEMKMNVEGKAFVVKFNQQTINKMYDYELVN